MADVIYHGPPAGYCATCHGEAAKAGRPVRKTSVCEYEICLVCESHLRNGLIHYRPSNGTEGRMFEGRCEDCRHHRADGDDLVMPKLIPPYGRCAFGILDRITMQQMGAPDDSSVNWFDPADLEDGCPATCKRFTDRNDPNGELRDPTPPDCIGQMMLGEMLDVPERKISLTQLEVSR